MRVIREFKCLRSGKYYPAGTEYPEADPLRVNELAGRGFLEHGIELPDAYPEPEPDAYQEPEPDAYPEPEERSVENAGGGKAGAARQRRGA